MRVGVGVGPVYASGSPSGCLTLIGGLILLPFRVLYLVIWLVVKLLKLVYWVGVGLFKAGRYVYEVVQSQRATHTRSMPGYVHRGEWTFK